MMFQRNKMNHASTSTREESDSENESEDDVFDYNKKNGFGTTKNIYTNIYKDSTKWYPGICILLLRWKGSVYKLLWTDFVLFVSAFTIISLIYRLVLVDYPVYRQTFELFCVFTQRFSNSLPVTFLIGLYVSAVVDRWWAQFMALPWPDQLAMKLVAFLPGNDYYTRNLRRTIIRYTNLSSLLVLRLISTKVKKEFPTYKSLLEAKVLLPHEAARLRKRDKTIPKEETSWTPMVWAINLIIQAKNRGKIKLDPPILASIQAGFEDIETQNRKLLNYSWVNYPLPYTQIATLAVFMHFVAALFGKQFLIPNDFVKDHRIFPNVTSTISYSARWPFTNHSPDFYVPIFTFIEFICYMGWIKVAETLLNPFGDDDEDFNLSYLIDRNLQVSYLIVDESEEDMEMYEDPFLKYGLPKNLRIDGKRKAKDKNGTEHNRNNSIRRVSVKQYNINLQNAPVQFANESAL